MVWKNDGRYGHKGGGTADLAKIVLGHGTEG